MTYSTYSNAMARPRTKKRKTGDERSAACGVTVTLPDHVVTEVLVRLPARSLARLRCTCRSWNAEVSLPGFQDRHHALAAAKLTFLEPAPTHMGSYRIRRRLSRRTLPWLSNCFDCPRVIGSKPCWGLVLIARPCEGYSVCNPTTGEILHLPRSHRPHCATVMGFHAPAREFKVVQLGIDEEVVGKLHAIVLTVGDARGWRAISSFQLGLGFTDDAASIDRDVQPVFADGCLHWSFRTNYLDKPHGVLSFSLADESFRRVPQPPFSMVDLVPVHLNGVRNYRLLRAKGIRSGSGEEVAMPVGKTLAELDGRLCMVRDVRHRSDHDVLLEIWKLQDYDTGSWSLDYRVDLPAPGQRQRQLLTAPWLVVPLTYLGGSRPGDKKRKLLVATTAHEAHVYDPDSGTLRTVASIDSSGDGDNDSIRLLLYQESLVRLPGMQHGLGNIKFVQLSNSEHM